MTHLSKIQEQFTRQGEAYKRLAYVADESGLRRVVALSQVKPLERVVDFACGPGYLTMAFAAAAAEAVGVDATETFLEGARAEAAQRNIGNIRFLQGDVSSTSLDPGEFHLAVCRAAFHHFEEPGKVLAEMCRVTRPDGRLLVLDMLASEVGAQAEEHNRIERLCDPTHVRALAESEFNALFDSQGLEPVYTGHGETGYTLDEWIAHGGPPPPPEKEIRMAMARSEAHDATGLRIWRVNGAIHFCHLGAAFLLKKRGAQ